MAKKKKQKADPRFVTLVVIILILVLIYILAKAFFWIALAIALIFGGVYIYQEFTKEEKN